MAKSSDQETLTEIPAGYQLRRYGTRWIRHWTGELYEVDEDDDSDDGDALYELVPIKR